MMTRRTNRRIFTLPFFAALLIIFSCGKETARTDALAELLPQRRAHVWHYFADGGVHETDAPENAPSQGERAWTEAVRISAASSALGDGRSAPSGYALVNRVGMLVFTGSDFALYTDSQIFPNRTADNLAFENDTPIFSLYRSAFFNTTERQPGDIHHFLAQFDAATHVVYPLITCDNLSLGDNAEVTDFVWDGNTFILSVKTTGAEKIDFNYLSVQSKLPLLSLAGANVAGNLLISESDQNYFRQLASPAPLDDAPERLKELLALLDEESVVLIECRSAGGRSPRYFTNQSENDSSAPLYARAIIADTYACLVFSDGTSYIKGALYGRHIVNGNRPLAFRLPKLPAGFEYSFFAISGGTMHCAWEETAFYKTGRSGFLSVDLDAVLYGGSANDVAQ